MLAILAVIILTTGAVLFGIHSLKAKPGDRWKDYENTFAMLTKASEELPPLENIEQHTLEVRYIDKSEKVKSRRIRLHVPKNVPRPMPLIYVPYYEINENAMELRRYLEQGCAVASSAKAYLP